MRPGKMRARIEIQSPPTHGQFEAPGPWTTVYKVRAEKKYVRSSEENQSSGQFEKTIYQFKIRFRKNISFDNRVIEGGEVFDIVGIENVNERNRELILDCVHIGRLGTRGL